MQVVCGNCQLSFQAPDGATGLVCPICRSPLRAPDAPAEPAAAAAHPIVDWNGGTIDDLVSLLSGPAWSARVEVLPVNGGNAIGEVHVIAGGVSEAMFEGRSTHDALEKLRGAKGTRFRIEQRLPNPANGDLAHAGPDQGKLEERPLAHLMRYCEDYVLTAGIEVWRGSENAKVDYRRGEIVGVTVGGIDAPERLAEVMKWSSGNYRIVAPKLTLPETAPKAPAPATVSVPKAPAPAAPVPVSPAVASAPNRTIFGMPAMDPTAIAAAAEKLKGAPNPVKSPGMANQAASPTAGPAAPTAPPRTQTPAAPVTPPRSATAPVAAAAPEPASSPRQSAPMAKTIFGVQAPAVAPAQAVSPTAPAAEPPPPAAAAPEKPAAPEAQKGGRQTAPTTQASRPPATTTAMSTSVAEADRTAKALQQKPRETPVWTYVGVGFIFGLALLGVYRLVIILAH